MDPSTIDAGTIERANELYWESEKSVNQIAESLDLSKGALYGLIEPLASGVGCPLCGAEVVYPNRTAQDKRRLDCPECDWDGAPDETVGFEDDDVEASAETRPKPAAAMSDMRSVWGGAMIGAALGLALVLWARRK